MDGLICAAAYPLRSAEGAVTQSCADLVAPLLCWFIPRKVGTGEVTASLTAATEMIISTVAQWAAVSLSASGVLIDVDSQVEEEWRSCSKSPLLGASVTKVGFTGVSF